MAIRSRPAGPVLHPSFPPVPPPSGAGGSRRSRSRVTAFHLALMAFLAVSGATPSAAAQNVVASAGIVLIVDDLGDSLVDGRRVIALPAPVACAILPHTPYGETLAQEAHDARKEVLLHLPMEPVGDSETGPGRIDTGMRALELGMTLDNDLSTVPHAVGVNNHMGSRLTQDREAMRQVMQGIRRHGHLYFVDSLTAQGSVAAQVAREEGVPALTRQVFLDDDRRPAAIEAQFDQLLALARRHRFALAIGHPHPETLAILERRLPLLAGTNVQVVAPSVMLNAPSTEVPSWPPSSSPSPKALKNSKP
jgi:uncharacterized protein